MTLARIEIRSQLGTLAVKTQRARLEGTPPEPKLTMRGNGGAAVGLKTTDPQIRIDNTRFRESVGIDTPLESWRKCAEKGNRSFNERIGGIVREGLAIMKIENGGGGGGQAIARIAANKGYKDVRLTIKPAGLPEIYGIMGSVDIRDDSGKVQTDWVDTADTRRYIPGSITVTWGREPRLEITVIPGSELNYPGSGKVGARLDTAI